MLQRSSLIAGLVAVALLAACGSDDDAATPDASSPATVQVPAGTDDNASGTDADASQVTEPDVPATDADTEVIDLTDVTTGLPADPCGLLTVEEAALVLTDPQPGIDAGAPAGAPITGCEWDDGAGLTVLELQIFDTMGEDISQLGADELLATRFDPEVAAAMEEVDLGQVGFAGAEGDDAVVLFVTPGAMYQLRLWAVGAADRPGQRWSEIRPAMLQVAEAVAGRAGS